MRHTLQVLWLSLCSIFFVSSAWAAGESISVNIIGGNTSRAQGSIPADKTAGAIAISGAYWNNVISRSGDGGVGSSDAWEAIASENLKQYTPGSTELKDVGLTMSAWAKCCYTSDASISTDTHNGDGYLLQGYLDDGQTDEGYGAQVRFDNIPYTTYDLYIYAGSDQATGQFAAIEVNGVQYLSEDTGVWGDRSTVHANEVTLTENTNYIKVTGLTASSVTIKEKRANSRAGLAGFQIVNREYRTISVNFGDSIANVSGSAGLFPVDASAWVNSGTGSATGGSPAAVSGVTLKDQYNETYSDATLKVASRGGAWNISSVPERTTEQAMLRGYIADSNGSNEACIEIENVPFSNYTVYVYFGGDFGHGAESKFPTYEINGKLYKGDGSATVEATATGAWGVVDQTQVADGRNTLVVTGQTASTLRIYASRYCTVDGITAAGVSGARGCISGIQIVDTGAVELTAREMTATVSADTNWSAIDWGDGVAAPTRRDTVTLTLENNATVSVDVPFPAKKIVGNGTGMVDLTAAAKPTVLQAEVAAGSTLNVRTDAIPVRTASTGTFAFYGGTSGFPRVVTLPTDSNGEYGAIHVGANTYARLHAPGSGNKKYTVTGEGVSSAVSLTTTHAWGATAGSTFEDIKLVVPSNAGNNFYLSSGMCSTVDGKGVHLEIGSDRQVVADRHGGGADTIQLASLTGAGSFNYNGNSAKLKLALEADCTSCGIGNGASLTIVASPAWEGEELPVFTYGANYPNITSTVIGNTDGTNPAKVLLTKANGNNYGTFTVNKNACLRFEGTEHIPFTKGSIVNNGTVEVKGSANSMLPPMSGTGDLAVEDSAKLCGSITSTGTVSINDGKTLTFAQHTDFGSTTVDGTATPTQSPSISGGSIELGEGASIAMVSFADSVTIASGKSLGGAGSLSGSVTFADGAIVDCTEGCPTVGTATFEGGLTIVVSEDAELPTGGMSLLSYTSKTETFTTENVTVKVVNASGIETTMPTSWEVTVGTSAITLATTNYEGTIPADGTSWSALNLTPASTDDVTLKLGTDVSEGVLTIDATNIVEINNLILSGTGRVVLNNADKLKIGNEISIASGMTLVLNGTETGDPLVVDAARITGAGSVEIAKGQVKFEDVAVDVPVTTLAATTNPEKAVGSLTLANTEETVQTIATVITNNGALVTDGKIALTNTANTSYGELTVNTGTLALTAKAESNAGDGDQGLGGKITIERLATLENKVAWVTSATTGKFPQVHVHGTLDMGEDTAWNFAAGSSLNLYSGAKVLGGDSSWDKVFAFAGALNIYDDENVAAEDKAITFDALLSVETTDALAIAIPSGVTLNMSDVISGTDKKLSFSGAGTAILSAANTYTGGTDIASGATVQVTNRAALGTSGTITGAGTLVIATDNTSASGDNRKPLANTTGLTASTWAGTVVVKTTGTAVWLQLGLYGHAGSKIQCHGVTGFFTYSDTDGSLTVNAPVELVKTADRDGLTIDDGSSHDDAAVTFAKITGAGKLDLNSNNKYYTVRLNDVVDYTGAITVSHARKKVIIADASDTTTTAVDGTIVIAKDVTAYSPWSKVSIADGKTLSMQVEDTKSATWTGALAGSGTFKKIGAGTLTFSPASVADATKTVVAAGTLNLGATAPKAITVQNGATFDYVGVANKVPGTITLEGGATLANTGSEVGNGSAQMTDIILTGDAKINASSNFGMIKNGYNPVTLTLNDHKLTKEGDGSFWFCNTTINGGEGETAGEIYVKEGAFTKVQNHATVINGNVKLSADVANAFDFGSDTVTLNGTLELETNATLGASPITGTGMLVKSGTDTTKLTGDLFTFIGAVRVDEGTLDLSEARLSPGNPTIAGVAEGATLILPPVQATIDNKLSGNAPTVTYTVAEDATVGGTVKVSVGGTEQSVTLVDSSTSVSFTGTVTKVDASLTGEDWWWDYEFNDEELVTVSDGKGVLSTGSDKVGIKFESLAQTEGVYNNKTLEDGAMYLQQTPWRDVSGGYPDEITAVMRCMPGEYNTTALISFGNSVNTNWAITLATGEDIADGDMQIILTQGNTKIATLASMTLKEATTAYHLYAFTIRTILENGVEKTRIEVCIDDYPPEVYTHPSKIALGHGFQIGSVHGTVAGGLTKYSATGDSGTLDFLRVSNVALSQGAVEALVDKYPYVSVNGKATRELTSATALWTTTETVEDNMPWSQTEKVKQDDGTVVDQTNKKNTPNDKTEIALTVKTDATISLNHEGMKDYESLTIDGTSTLTFDKESTGTIDPGSAKILTDVVIPYGLVDLAGTAVTITGADANNPVTLTFDVANLAANTWKATAFELTGTVAKTHGSVAITPATGDASLKGRTVTLREANGHTYVDIKVPAMMATVTADANWDELEWTVDTTTGVEAETFTLTGSGTVTLPTDTLGANAKLVIGEGVNVVSEGVLPLATGALSGAGALTVKSSALPTNLATLPADGWTGTIVLQVAEDTTLTADLAAKSAYEFVSIATGETVPVVTLSGSQTGSKSMTIGDGTKAITVKVSEANGNYTGTWTVNEKATLSNEDNTNYNSFGGEDATMVVNGTLSLKPGATENGSHIWFSIEGTGSISVEADAYIEGAVTVSGELTIANGVTLTLSNNASVNGPSIACDGALSGTGVTIAEGKSLSGAGTISAPVIFADKAVLVPSSVEVTGNVTWSGSVTVKVASAPEAGASTTLLTKAGITIPTYEIYIGDATTSTTELVLAVQGDALVVTQKPSATSGEGAAVTPPAGGATEENAGTVTVVVPTETTEGETGTPSNVENQTVTQAVVDAIVDAAAKQNVVTVTGVEVVPLGGPIASDAAPEVVAKAVANALGAAELFENVVTVTPDVDDKTKGTAKITYAFGIEKLTVENDNGTLYIVLKAKVSNNADATMNTADYAGDDTIVTVTAVVPDGDGTTPTVELAEDTTRTPEKGAKWFKAELSALSRLGTYSFSIDAKKKATSTP